MLSLFSIYNLQKKLFWCFIVLLCTIVFSYSYFIQETIHNIIERKNAEKEISAFTASIGELEVAYNATRNTITQEYARSLGFGEPSKKSYVKRKQFAQN